MVNRDVGLLRAMLAFARPKTNSLAKRMRAQYVKETITVTAA